MTGTTAESELDLTLRRFKAEAKYNTVTTPRYRCRYFVWGSGPPLLFIHGLTDRAISFVRPMARLVDRFTCIGFDLAEGSGDGARIGAYRHRHHVEDLIFLLDHLSYDCVNLLGSSYGSTIALRALGTYPKRFLRCILQGGFARRPLHWYERGPARATRFWPGRLREVPGRSVVLARLDGPQFAGAPPDVYSFFLNCTESTPIRALTRRALVLDRLDLRLWLPDILQPVLLLGGDDDRIVPMSCETALESGLPNVRRVVIVRCGHYPQYTHPGQMTDAIASFLLP